MAQYSTLYIHHTIARVPQRHGRLMGGWGRWGAASVQGRGNELLRVGWCWWCGGGGGGDTGRTARACIHTRTCTHTRARAHAHTHTCNGNMQMYIYIYIHIHMIYTYISAYVNICTYDLPMECTMVYIHVRVYVRVYDTYIHVRTIWFHHAGQSLGEAEKRTGESLPYADLHEYKSHAYLVCITYIQGQICRYVTVYTILYVKPSTSGQVSKCYTQIYVYTCA
jgi:hypothetical protein